MRGLQQTPADDAEALAQDAATSPGEPEDAALAPEPELRAAGQQQPLVDEPEATIIPQAAPPAQSEIVAEEALTELGVAFPPTEADRPIESAQADGIQASIQLAVNFDSRELTITLAGEEQPLHVVYDGHSWRAGPDQG